MEKKNSRQKILVVQKNCKKCSGFISLLNSFHADFLILDANSRDGEKFLKNHPVMFTPTFFLLEDETEILRAQTVEELKQILETVM